MSFTLEYRETSNCLVGCLMGPQSAQTVIAQMQALFDHPKHVSGVAFMNIVCDDADLSEVTYPVLRDEVMPYLLRRIDGRPLTRKVALVTRLNHHEPLGRLWAAMIPSDFGPPFRFFVSVNEAEAWIGQDENQARLDATIQKPIGP